MNRIKQKIHITSHGQLNFFNYNGLRTPAIVDLYKHEIAILKNMGVEFEVVKEDPPIKTIVVDVDKLLKENTPKNIVAEEINTPIVKKFNEQFNEQPKTKIIQVDDIVNKEVDDLLTPNKKEGKK